MKRFRNCSTSILDLIESPRVRGCSIHVTIRLSEPPSTQVQQQLEAIGVAITSSAGEILVGIVQIEELPKLLSLPEVRWVEGGRGLVSEKDKNLDA
jgi:hypothetical protein